MTGTLINAATVVIGGALGALLEARLPERLRSTVVAGLGLFTLALGMQMFLKTENPLVVLGSLLIGALLGEWWRIEDGLAWLGKALDRRLNGQNGDQSGRFVRGFLTASLLFCVGPMAILGAIQDGLTGDTSLLVVKAVMDGFAALAFASTFGIGVSFSALALLVYQGSITLLAEQFHSIVTQTMMNELTAAGGVILLGLAISSILEIKKLRMGNFLPALAVAPILVAILDLINK